MAFDMVDSDKRQLACEGQRLGVGDANQQRAYQTWAFGDSDGGQVIETRVGLFESEAHNGHDGAQVFARSQLGNNAAIFSVRELGCDHGRQNRDSIFHNRRRGFIARCFYS